MRPYRAIPKDGKDFVYGWYFKSFTSGLSFIITDATNHPYRFTKTKDMFVEVIPETVGQQVGLKDKNGKEIYKGDIVKTFDEWVSEICFGSFQSHMSGELNIGFYCKDANGNTRPMSTISSEYKIIGDIHTTPELMEKQ